MKKSLLILSLALIFSCTKEKETEQIIPSNEEICIKFDPLTPQYLLLAGVEGLIKKWELTYELAATGERFEAFTPDGIQLTSKTETNIFYWLPNKRIVEYTPGTTNVQVMDTGTYVLKKTDFAAIKNMYSYIEFDKIDSTSKVTAWIKTNLSTGVNPFILSKVTFNEFLGSFYISPILNNPDFKIKVRVKAKLVGFEKKKSIDIINEAESTR